MGGVGLWGKKRPPSDPLLHTPEWRKARAYWKREGQRQGIPCWRCGRPIDYVGAYFVTNPMTGKRTVNGAAFTLGHRVSRHLAASLGWTDEQTNDLSNTAPEHASCSGRSGYMDQARRRNSSAIGSLPKATSVQDLASGSSRGRSAWYGDTRVTIPPDQQAAVADRWR
jgi:hypothetical protein